MKAKKKEDAPATKAKTPRKSRPKSTTSAESHLEQRFRRIWAIVAADLPLEAQKKNVVTGRRYVYDFCIPCADVLIEVNGGTFAKGNSGHSSGTGIARDADKVNQAQIYGYDIFVLTVDKLTTEYITEIAEYCRAKGYFDERELNH